MIGDRVRHHKTNTWVEVLQPSLSRYNNQLHSSTKTTPNNHAHNLVKVIQVRTNLILKEKAHRNKHLRSTKEHTTLTSIHPPTKNILPQFSGSFLFPKNMAPRPVDVLRASARRAPEVENSEIIAELLDALGVSGAPGTRPDRARNDGGSGGSGGSSEHHRHGTCGWDAQGT